MTDQRCLPSDGRAWHQILPPKATSFQKNQAKYLDNGELELWYNPDDGYYTQETRAPWDAQSLDLERFLGNQRITALLERQAAVNPYGEGSG